MKHFSPSKAWFVVRGVDLGGIRGRSKFVEEEKGQGRYTHCSMIGAKADSFALRSARRNLRSSCHAGSAMRESQARPISRRADYGLIAPRPAGRPTNCLSADRPALPRTSTTTTLLHTPPHSTMGRVLLKVTFLSLPSPASAHPIQPPFSRLSFSATVGQSIHLTQYIPLSPQ